LKRRTCPYLPHPIYSANPSTGKTSSEGTNHTPVANEGTRFEARAMAATIKLKLDKYYRTNGIIPKGPLPFGLKVAKEWPKKIDFADDSTNSIIPDINVTPAEDVLWENETNLTGSRMISPTKMLAVGNELNETTIQDLQKNYTYTVVVDLTQAPSF
jgi:hypothetical protein